MALAKRFASRAAASTANAKTTWARDTTAIRPSTARRKSARTTNRRLPAARTPETAAGAVVADFWSLHHSVTTERSELAPDGALAVATVVDAIVALLAEAHDAIAANRAAGALRRCETREREAERR